MMYDARGLREWLVATLESKWQAVRDALNERGRRLWAGAEARAIGRGGVSAVHRATGLSRTTVARGVAEVGRGESLADGRQRRPGAGRPRLEDTDATLKADLDTLVEPTTRGDPQTPLRWTCKSLRRLADELCRMRKGRSISPQKVGQLLHEQGYSLQANRKTREGSKHPDRNAQFEYIQAQVKSFQARGQPVVSVDTKKKELVGDFRNGGREWRPKGTPEEVRVHDFVDAELGKVIPYGVYDLAKNDGFVNVGVDHDTPEFAVGSIGQWWRMMGRPAYPGARELLVTADGGGSNASRALAWKTELQQLADRTGLRITVAHFPPGTSKWNKIEHRMFCHITQNWRGKPLLTREVVVKLIASTTTRAGLRIRARLDTGKYETGTTVTKAEMKNVRLERHAFHGDWNYSIAPSG